MDTSLVDSGQYIGGFIPQMPPVSESQAFGCLKWMRPPGKKVHTRFKKIAGDLKY